MACWKEQHGVPPNPCSCPCMAARSPQPSHTQRAPSLRFGSVLLTSTGLCLLLRHNWHSRWRKIQILVSRLFGSCGCCRQGWCHRLQSCSVGHGPHCLLRTGPCGAAAYHNGLGEVPAEDGVHLLTGERVEAEILPCLNAIPTRS